MQDRGLVMYLSYGSGPHVQEAIFSHLTAQHHGVNEHIHFVVYTDTPDLFVPWGIEVVPLSSEQLATWAGPHNFNHRRKIMAMEDALGRFGLPTVLLDGDTYFCRPPISMFTRLSPGRSLMHLREGELRYMDPELCGAVGQVLGVDVSSRAVMWNAGVVGIHPADKGLIPEVLSITDRLLDQIKRHTPEQFAFSHVLGTQTKLGPSREIFHYWPPYLHKPFRGKLPGIIEKCQGLSDVQARGRYCYANRPRPDLGALVKRQVRKLKRTMGLGKFIADSNG